MGRAEAFAMQNKPWPSFVDGLANGVGYSLILFIVGFFREFLGSGRLFGIQVLPLATENGWYVPNGLMLLAPGAFFVIALSIWLVRTLRPDQVEEN